MQVGAHTLAKAQLAGSAHLWGDQTCVQEGEFDAKGVEFGVIAKGVANVGHVAGGPVRHGEVLGEKRGRRIKP